MKDTKCVKKIKIQKVKKIQKRKQQNNRNRDSLSQSIANSNIKTINLFDLIHFLKFYNFRDMDSIKFNCN